MVGYIYIMRNPCLQGLLKIGFARDVEKRRKSLSNSSVPDDYEILSKFHVIDMDKAEKQVFNALRDYRYRDRKEFFTCNLALAREVCAFAQESVNDFCPSNVSPDIDEMFEVVVSRELFDMDVDLTS